MQFTRWDTYAFKNDMLTLFSSFRAGMYLHPVIQACWGCMLALSTVFLNALVAVEVFLHDCSYHVMNRSLLPCVVGIAVKDLLEHSVPREDALLPLHEFRLHNFPWISRRRAAAPANPKQHDDASNHGGMLVWKYVNMGVCVCVCVCVWVIALVCYTFHACISVSVFVLSQSCIVRRMHFFKLLHQALFWNQLA